MADSGSDSTRDRAATGPNSNDNEGDLMAITKRTRFEVLRRDNHTCRYCGLTAPATELTIDHVTPTALGGGDDPANLVVACKACNAGKASIAPGSPLVEDVKELDLKWAGAFARVAAARAQQREKRDEYAARFHARWESWGYGLNRDKQFPMPGNWLPSISKFYAMGVPCEDIEELVDVALGNDRIYYDEKFRYFAGCVWRLITEMQEAAKVLLEAEEVDGA